LSSWQPFLWGATAAACIVAGFFFLRFWIASRDRFFVYFTVAFWLLALNWVALAAIGRSPESVHPAYVIRLGAFLLIVIAIVDKNRRG
jgi:hypothetical protein